MVRRLTATEHRGYFQGLPLVVTEVVVLDTGRKNEIVVRNRALAGEHDAGVRVDPDDLRHEDRHVLLPSQDRADRCGDLVRGKETGRDLVEHGPEEVVVVFVNDCHGDWRPGEPARDGEAAEASTDDDDTR